MPTNDISDDARTADRDNSRDRKPARASHSKVANRQILEGEDSEEVRAAYEKILAEKATKKATKKAAKKWKKHRK